MTAKSRSASAWVSAAVGSSITKTEGAVSSRPAAPPAPSACGRRSTGSRRGRPGRYGSIPNRASASAARARIDRASPRPSRSGAGCGGTGGCSRPRDSDGTMLSSWCTNRSPSAAASAGPVSRRLSAIDLDRHASASMMPANLDQGGFSGPVLTHQRMHFTGAQRSGSRRAAPGRTHSSCRVPDRVSVRMAPLERPEVGAADAGCPEWSCDRSVTRPRSPS
jgi:hypothetical protein